MSEPSGTPSVSSRLTSLDYRGQLSVLEDYHTQWRESVSELNHLIEDLQWPPELRAHLFSTPIGLIKKYAGMTFAPPHREGASFQEELDTIQEYIAWSSKCYQVARQTRLERDDRTDVGEVFDSTEMTRMTKMRADLLGQRADLVWMEPVMSEVENISLILESILEAFYQETLEEGGLKHRSQVDMMLKENEERKKHLSELQELISERWISNDSSEREQVLETISRAAMKDQTEGTTHLDPEVIQKLETCDIDLKDLAADFDELSGTVWTQTYPKLTGHLTRLAEVAALAEQISTGNKTRKKTAASSAPSTGKKSRGKEARTKHHMQSPMPSPTTTLPLILHDSHWQGQNQGEAVESSTPEEFEPPSGPTIIITRAENEDGVYPTPTPHGGHDSARQRLWTELKDWNQLIDQGGDYLLADTIADPSIVAGCKIYSILGDPKLHNREEFLSDAKSTTERISERHVEWQTFLNQLTEHARDDKEALSVLKVFKLKSAWQMSRLEHSAKTHKLSLFPKVDKTSRKKPATEKELYNKLTKQVSQLQGYLQGIRTVKDYIQWKAGGDLTENEEVEDEIRQRAYDTYRNSLHITYSLSKIRYSLSDMFTQEALESQPEKRIKDDQTVFDEAKDHISSATEMHGEAGEGVTWAESALAFRKENWEEWKDSTFRGQTYPSLKTTFFEKDVIYQYRAAESELGRELNILHEMVDGKIANMENWVLSEMEGGKWLDIRRAGLQELQSMLTGFERTEYQDEEVVEDSTETFY
ncbi:hypothetical protein M231_04795 [Tremella mesenterica]|uniref:Uncharacterized protein n=1 Tax=Tremella mesenterica TaxID=5217 RepID=A0A4Q1BJR6_TREME|nr:uncharacterized protein TREMEDRAFT_64432 [Tremella mesenterica DSM 1558]EIW67192.1 hypothetical protein TREMEDRAFT_64432 [Tremella mesenterica DSM 1558]RXK37906.1 hypothetical protein M231_04795 [Tremella mesenterica]